MDELVFCEDVNLVIVVVEDPMLQVNLGEGLVEVKD